MLFSAIEALGLSLFVFVVFAATSADGATAWWDKAWTHRVGVPIPPKAGRLLRMPIPDGAQESGIRCILTGRARPVRHWVPTVEMSAPVRVAESPTVHYGFPRIVRAKDGGLLLFYRVGTTHAYDDAHIVVRRSTDDGRTWGGVQTLWQPQAGRSAHNPVALVVPSGRVVLWASDYFYSAKPTKRLPCVWSHSLDHGRTWAAFDHFDRDPSRSTYYVTDATVTSDGLLAGSAAFPPGGVGKCHTEMWHSADGGLSWAVRSRLTQPAENKGDEIALLETEPGTLLCLLRDRQRHETYRLWSRDGGRTWSPRESIRPMLGCVLQRPFLTRLDAKTVMLSGRDCRRKLVVFYISRDNGRTFAERHVLDTYQKDGGYTSALALAPGKVLMTWYSDSGTTPLKPDIKSAILTLPAPSRRLWVWLPKQPTAGERLHVYFGNPHAASADNRAMALVDPARCTEVTPDASPTERSRP